VRWASVAAAETSVGEGEVEASQAVRMEACLVAEKVGRVEWGGEVRGVVGLRREEELRRGRGVCVPVGAGERVVWRRAREEVERVRGSWGRGLVEVCRIMVVAREEGER
jgi:hypothetical protein